MTNYLPLNLQWDEVAAWHTSVCERCDSAISACSSVIKSLRKDGHKTEDLHPLDILKGLLINDSTCQFFGSPDSKPVILPEGTDFPSRIEQQYWGRRVYYHAKELRRGYECLKEIENTDRVAKRLTTLQVLEDRFGTEFKGNGPLPEALKEAMRNSSDPLFFADFTFTQIDPILHSSLLYLNMPEIKKSTDLIGFLMDNVRSFVTRLMLADTEFGLEELPVVDDAHLWWGHYELLKREGQNYSANGESGYSMAAKVCHRLIYKGSQSCKTPEQSIAIQQMPPDAYGIRRTRLLIVLNGIKISMLMPPDVAPDLSERLSKYIMSHFYFIKKYGLASVYHQGLALQFSSTAMSYYNRFIANKCEIEKGLAVQEKHNVSENIVTAKQLGITRPDTKAWLLESGGFLIESPDGSTISIAMDIGAGFFKIIRGLIENGGMATKSQLQDRTGISDPGRVIKRTLDNPEYSALKTHVKRPGKKSAGGYTTTIRIKTQSDNEVGYE